MNLYITKSFGKHANYIPGQSICKIYEKNLDIVKPCYHKHFYCPLLSPSLQPRFHCNTAYIVYMYHVSCSSFNPLNPNSDQDQFSPNNIHMLPREMVMRVNKIIT